MHILNMGKCICTPPSPHALFAVSSVACIVSAWISRAQSPGSAGVYQFMKCRHSVMRMDAVATIEVVAEAALTS